MFLTITINIILPRIFLKHGIQFVFYVMGSDVVMVGAVKES